MDDIIEETIARHQKGLILVITGNGKGKTTAAMGQAMRAAGHGKKVLIIQFMKGRKYGEVLCAEQCVPNIAIVQCGTDSFVMKNNLAPVDIELARRGLELAQEAISSGAYDMVVLDELNVAMDFGLLPIQDVLALLESKPSHVDVVVTGRNAPEAVIALADTVSEVREIKHHFHQGIKERAGIEF